MEYPTRYTGPHGPDPTKSRDERKAELMRLIETVEGCETLRNLRYAAEGVPRRIEPRAWRGVPISTFVEAILRVEYGGAEVGPTGDPSPSPVA